MCYPALGNSLQKKFRLMSPQYKSFCTDRFSRLN